MTNEPSNAKDGTRVEDGLWYFKAFRNDPPMIVRVTDDQVEYAFGLHEVDDLLRSLPHAQFIRRVPTPDELERIENAVDLVDLMRDEFARIKAIVPDNAEIVGLCDRAATEITQNVRVIKQLDEARTAIANMRDRIDCDAIEIGCFYNQIAERDKADAGVKEVIEMMGKLLNEQRVPTLLDIHEMADRLLATIPESSLTTPPSDRSKHENG